MEFNENDLERLKKEIEKFEQSLEAKSDEQRRRYLINFREKYKDIKTESFLVFKAHVFCFFPIYLN